MLTCLGFASIETIRPGDYVYSRDMQTGAIEEQAVLDVYEREVYETYSITIGDEEIEATAEHPFYTLDDGWVAAEDLEVGDEVATAEGESESVDDIVPNILDEPITVYNFAVMDNHNYFVGENKFLVHNMCATDPNASKSTLGKAAETQADEIKRGIKTGGAYKDVPANGGQVHHMPADSVSPYSKNNGPGIRMDTSDHMKTASWGRSKSAQAYRAKQKELIDKGLFRKAQQMDIENVRELFGNKYDEAIQQMLEYTEKLLE